MTSGTSLLLYLLTLLALWTAGRVAASRETAAAVRAAVEANREPISPWPARGCAAEG